jgi:DNA replication regulator DPB11
VITCLLSLIYLNILQSVLRYRLPVFSSVTLSLSGIDDLSRRTKINKLLVQQGGTYLKNLERPVRVTHLLCAGDEQTEKMRYAEKFNRSGEAHIHLVWEEWFWDSLEYGGACHF